MKFVCDVDVDFCIESGTSLIELNFQNLKNLIMKKLQKNTGTCSDEQKKRLDSVKHKEWMEAQKDVLPTIARLLHGRVKTDKDGQVEMVGGYTKYGAHSESELGGNALFHYWGLIVQTLYDGTCTWDPELSLAEQLNEMAEPVIDEAVKEYRSRKKEEERLGVDSTPVDFDVDWLGEEDGDLSTTVEMTGGVVGMTDDVDAEASRHMKWETICGAADGDKELEAFVQVTGECGTMKEVNERLGLKGDDRDRLMKRLKRRFDKNSYPMGKRRKSEKIKVKSEKFFGKERRFLANFGQ